MMPEGTIPRLHLIKTGIFFRWKKVYLHPSNHRTTTESQMLTPLRGNRTCTPCTDIKGGSFPLWLLHSCLFKDLWLQSAQGGNSSLPSPPYHTSSVSLGRRFYFSRSRKEREQRNTVTSTVLPCRLPTGLTPCRGTAKATSQTSEAAVFCESKTYQPLPNSSCFPLNSRPFPCLTELRDHIGLS